MKTKVLLGMAIASLMVSGAAAQQSPAPARDNPPAVVQPGPTNAPTLRGQWRASKLIGVDVYNEQNEKLGDIDELIVDRSGKISGVVIGVGGFLGMGQRDIFIPMEKLKFVEEPLRSSTVPDANRPATTGAADQRADRATRETRRDRNDWYPDHAVLSGATKESVKNLTEFRYE